MSAAVAADLPRHAVAVPAPVPVFTWAGVYAGVNAGAAWRNDDTDFDRSIYGGPFARGFAPEFVAEELNLTLEQFLPGPRAIVFQDGSAPNCCGSKDRTSFIGGAQVGVNGQWGGLVAGLEADFNWVNQDRKLNGFETGNFFFENEFAPAAGPFFSGEGAAAIADGLAPAPAGIRYQGSTRFSERKSDWVSTVRGRLGFAWDRFLVYGTGGVAFQGAGNITSSTTLTRTDCNPNVVFFSTVTPASCASTVDNYGTITSQRNQVGWAAGVGAEYAFLNNLSIGVEYLHADFGSYNVAFVDPVLTAAQDRRPFRAPGLVMVASLDGRDGAAGDAAPAPVTRHVRVKDSIDMVRLKLNWRFDTANLFTP